MTTVEEDGTQARVDGLLEVLRAAEVDFRQSYSRVLDVAAERVGAVSGFGTTARLRRRSSCAVFGEERQRRPHDAKLLAG
ncbi:MAG: hypothetical protein ACRDTA_30045 [Pseudonocardiaceae bacterium]